MRARILGLLSGRQHKSSPRWPSPTAVAPRANRSPPRSIRAAEPGSDRNLRWPAVSRWQGPAPIHPESSVPGSCIAGSFSASWGCPLRNSLLASRIGLRPLRTDACGPARLQASALFKNSGDGRHPHQLVSAGDPKTVVENSAVQGCTSNGRWAWPRGQRSTWPWCGGAARHAVRLHRHRAGARSLHVADHGAARAGGVAGTTTTPTPHPHRATGLRAKALLVRVIKDPHRHQGRPPVSQISIAGPHAVHLPRDRHIGIPARRSARPDRASCCARMRPWSAQPNTAVVAASSAPMPKPPAETWPGDIAYLRATWQPDPRQGAAPRRPACCTGTWSLVRTRAARPDHQSAPTPSRIDSALRYQVLRQFTDTFMP